MARQGPFLTQPPLHTAGVPDGMKIIDNGQGSDPFFANGQFSSHTHVQHDLPHAPVAFPFSRQQSNHSVVINNSTRISDLTPRPVQDDDFHRKKLTSYEVYALTKDDTGARSSKDKNFRRDRKDEEPSWGRVAVSKILYSQDDIAKKVKTLNEGHKKVTDKFGKLFPHQQAQVSNLLQSRSQEELDPSFEWSVGQLEQNIITNKRTGKRETATLIAYLKRAPKQEVNVTMLYHSLQRSRYQASRAQSFEDRSSPIAENMSSLESARLRIDGAPRQKMPDRMLGRPPLGLHDVDPNLVIVEEHLEIPGQMARARSRSRPVIIDNLQQRLPQSRMRRDQSPRRSESRPARCRESKSDDSGSSSITSSSEHDSYDSDTAPSSPESSTHRGRREKKHDSRRQASRHQSSGDQVVIETRRGSYHGSSRYPPPESVRRSEYSHERTRSDPHVDPVIAEEIFRAGTLAGVHIAGREPRPTAPRGFNSVDVVLHGEDTDFRRHDARRGSVTDDLPLLRSDLRADELAFRHREDQRLRGAERRTEEDLGEWRIDESRARSTNDRIARDNLSRDLSRPGYGRRFADPFPWRRREGPVPLPLAPDRVFEYSRNPFAPVRQQRSYRL
ncbi:MAG: hypothetical protein M1818_007293 [Claussenomyces sp. TS43310]|nr:MAG: hypothetical protein M1818_007293 [Claussenomyces sp. TS43310]